MQQEPVQFNTPEPFKQDEMSASNSIEKSEEIFQTGSNKNSEIKSTLWQSLNDRTTTKRPIAKPLTTKTPSIKMATERMDLDYSDVNYYIQNNPQNVFRPNLVPSIPDPAGNNLNSFFPHLTPDITSRNIQEDMHMILGQNTKILTM